MDCDLEAVHDLEDSTFMIVIGVFSFQETTTQAGSVLCGVEHTHITFVGAAIFAKFVIIPAK